MIRFRLFGKTIIIATIDDHPAQDSHERWHQIGVWVTGEGIQILVEDMTNQHLLNAWFYLNRRAESLAAYSILTSETVLHGFSIYPHIVKVMKEREL